MISDPKSSHKSETIVALHGFLGTPSDFDFLGPLILKPDYLSLIKNGAIDFRDWARAFDKHFAPEDKFHLIGYSMGGRFALEYADQFRTKLSKLTLISVNLNKNISETEIIKRRGTDQTWANRFLTDDLETVIGDWNQQAVFQGSINTPDRKIKDIDRELMSILLTRFSSNDQKCFFNEIRSWDLDIRLISGEFDHKYVTQNSSFKGLGHISDTVVSQSGHRVFVDNPAELIKLLQ